MGCDIHSTAERRINGAWQTIPDLCPFDWRSYGIFAFLANVRNYSAVPPISEPRGTPEDSPSYDDDDMDRHSHSWLSVEELLSFDYDKAMEDRRVTREVEPGHFNGGCTAELGKGKVTTFRDFLGPRFFEDLDALKTARADRIVFSFDS